MAPALETGVLLSDRLRNTSIVSWRELKYPDTSYLPQNSLFTGLQLSANTNFQYKVTDAVTAFVFGNAQRYLTAQAYPWQSYMLEGVGAGVSYRFIDPIFKSQLPWNVTLSAAQQWWQYDAPDPTIDPNTGRAQIGYDPEPRPVHPDRRTDHVQRFGRTVQPGGDGTELRVRQQRFHGGPELAVLVRGRRRWRGHRQGS